MTAPPAILIVEDEAIVAEDLANKLTGLGYAVAGRTARGAEAVALTRRHRPALVLMDIRLAGAMDGLAAARTIRQECRVPVIFLTAHSDGSTVEQAGQMEAAGYILKPFDERDLRVQIEMALYKHAAEQRLRENEERLAGIVTSAMDAIVSVDEDQRITLFNAAAERMFGVPADAMIGRPLAELIPERFREAHEQHVRQFGQGGVTSRRMGALGEVRGRRVNGEEFPIEASISQVVVAGRKLFTVILRDITERKRAEEALRESEVRFRAMADAAPVLIWVSGPDRRCTYFNKQWLAFTGRALEQELGDGWAEGVHPDDGQRCLATYVQAFDARRPFEMEYRLRRADGEYRWLLDRGLPRYDSPDRFVGYIGSCVDITILKQAEQEMARSNAELERRVAARTAALRLTNEELVRLLDEQRRLEAEVAEISNREQQRIGQDLHDGLTQQLTGIAYLSQTLAEELAEHSCVGQRSAARISELSRQAIIDARNLARGLCPVSPEPLGLVTALADFAATVRSTYRLRCRWECRRPVPVADNAVASHLYRIAQEAVQNTVKHGRASRVTVALRQVRGSIELRILDNGRGMTRPVPGQGGLGLHTMEYRARACGGSVTIGPGPRGGTLVMCTVPMPAPAERKHHERKISRRPKKHQGQSAAGGRSSGRPRRAHSAHQPRT